MNKHKEMIEKIKYGHLLDNKDFSEMESFIVQTPNIKDFLNPDKAFEILKRGLWEYSSKTQKLEIIKIRLEPIIAEYTSCAYLYAYEFIKGGFELGEPAISLDRDFSCAYACDVICKRFPLGEKAISQNSIKSYHYAFSLGKRFELGEEAIAKNAETALSYATRIIKGRFPLGEKEIRKSPRIKFLYDRMLRRVLVMGL